jgi:heterodisulfide reductase subunit B
MNEEKDYHGEVEVLHFLNFLRDEIGWDKVRAAVKSPLNGLKVATYYGCTLVRPKNVAIEPPGDAKIMREFLEAIGAAAVDFPAATTCCGSYQILSNPDAALEVASTIVEGAARAGAEAIILSCPLCEFNLGKKQAELLQKGKISKEIPVYYFTQLLALALGLDPGTYRLDLNAASSAQLLKAKNFPVDAPAGA